MTALTIAIELPAANVAAAVNFLRGSRPDAFRAIDELHFLSMFVIDEWNGEEPRVCLEASFDGTRGQFLNRLLEEPAARTVLEGAFDFCMRRPSAGASAAEWRAFLESGEIANKIFYAGMPAHDVRRIDDERAFAGRVEAVVAGLGAPESRRAANVRRVWDALSDAERDFAMRAPRRPFYVRLGARPLQAVYEAVGTPLYQIGLAAILLIAAELVGLPLWSWLRPPLRTIEITLCWEYVLACVWALATIAWLALLVGEFPAALTSRMRLFVILTRLSGYIAATLRALLAFAALLGLIAVLHWFAWIVLLGLLLAVTAVALVLLLVWAIRLLGIALQEPNDRVREMLWRPDHLADVSEPENEGEQTHFISVAPIRPGRLRMVVLKAVLWWVGTLATILHNPRGLFSTQSIHFARWCILPGRRMMFISNYGGSFGGYLGIFATLGAPGVSAIWTNIDGFPRGFALFGDGVRDEQRFKCYARHTQVRTLLWYRRYPDLSVGAIGRHAEIREDLARFARVRTQDGERIHEAELDAFLRRFSSPRP